MPISNNRKVVIVTLIAIAVAGVLAAKLYVNKRSDEAEASKADVSSGRPTVYLFYDESDQDEGCRTIYEAFDLARASFPAQIQSSKIDVYQDEALFDKYGVRVLPTVLFVDGKGEERQRIEGEGGEVKQRLVSAFARVQEILNP